MKKMDNKKFNRLYYGVFICTLFSAILCFVIGDGDLSYDKYVTAFYGDSYGKIISIINQKVIIAGVDTRVIPVLPLNVKATLITVIVFIAGCVAVQLHAKKSIFIALAGCMSISFIQWWLIYKGILYIPIIEIIVFAGFTYVLLSVIKKIIYNYNTRNLPIGAVVKFAKNIVNMESETTYANYLINNKKQIERSLSAKLVHPALTKDSSLLKKIAAESHRNKKFVETQVFGNDKQTRTTVLQTRTKLFKDFEYLAFIPMPIIDKSSEELVYTVIGIDKKMSVQRASHVSTMLFSMYIYFRARHERDEHQRVYFSMLSLMISVIDAKDPVTAGHSQRVAELSRDLGTWLGLDKNQMFELEFASLMHDIGKIGVSDYVLNKPSIFTKSDFEQMKNHTVRGAEMLKEVGMSEAIVEGVRYHHERIDGRGYPDGIKGDEINLIAKIIKIADVYDALTSKRQYKDAWKIDKAMNIIYNGRGIEFDSDIADVFIEHMAPDTWIPPIQSTKKSGIDSLVDKAVSISVDFYQKYSAEMDDNYVLMSRNKDKVDFCCEDSFMGYDWGETFNNRKFLVEKPFIVAYEDKTESLVFAQSSDDEHVEKIYYYFFKGFINLGVYVLKRENVGVVLDILLREYGSPVKVSDEFMAYKCNKMRIVFYHTNDDKCLLIYAPEYMCANYVFDSEKTDMAG